MFESAVQLRRHLLIFEATVLLRQHLLITEATIQLRRHLLITEASFICHILYTRIWVCRLSPKYCDISRLGERVRYMASRLIADIPTKECESPPDQHMPIVYKSRAWLGHRCFFFTHNLSSPYCPLQSLLQILLWFGAFLPDTSWMKNTLVYAFMKPVIVLKYFLLFFVLEGKIDLLIEFLTFSQKGVSPCTGSVGFTSWPQKVDGDKWRNGWLQFDIYKK